MSNPIEPLGQEVTGPPATYPPANLTLQGKHGITLVPLHESHLPSLFLNLGGPEHAHLYRYMPVGPLNDIEGFTTLLQSQIDNPDQQVFAILSSDPVHASNRRHEREGPEPKDETAISIISYMNIVPLNRSLEIGHVLFSPTLQRTTVATEAIYLLMRWAIEEAGYARVEWKCHDFNEPSKRAAGRMGFVFEGVFRKHMVVKGKRRDSCWFSCTDDDWFGGKVKESIEGWLAEGNFVEGRQLRSLEEVRRELRGEVGDATGGLQVSNRLEG